MSLQAEEREISTPLHRSMRLLLLQAYFLLFMIRLGLTSFGFGRMFRFITQVKPRNISNPDIQGKIELINRAVKAASCYHFCRIQCLERSFVLYYLLKREGIPADLCIGVAQFPLAFHCWVEHEGVVLNDSLPILKDKYTEMLRA